MVKRTRLPYATPKRNTRTGRLEWWFRRGSTWKLLPGDPGTDPKAAKLYWQRRTGKALAPKAQTIAEVIRSYRLTPKFIALKASTHRVYEYRLRYIEDSSGKVLATRISRADVIAARDANAHRPSAANQMLAVLSALMEHAIDLGWRIDNPAHGVEPLPGGPGHQPWSKGEIARFRATATGPVRTAWSFAWARASASATCSGCGGTTSRAAKSTSCKRKPAPNSGYPSRPTWPPTSAPSRAAPARQSWLSRTAHPSAMTRCADGSRRRARRPIATIARFTGYARTRRSNSSRPGAARTRSCQSRGTSHPRRCASTARGPGNASWRGRRERG